VCFLFTVGVYTVMGMIDYILYGVAFVALCGFLSFMPSQRAKKDQETEARLSPWEA
jgi:hypothetical protein